MNPYISAPKNLLYFSLFPPSLAVVCLYSTVPEQAPERQGGRYLWGFALTLCGFSGVASGGGSKE